MQLGCFQTENILIKIFACKILKMLIHKTIVAGKFERLRHTVLFQASNFQHMTFVLPKPTEGADAQTCMVRFKRMVLSLPMSNLRWLQNPKAMEKKA